MDLGEHTCKMCGDKFSTVRGLNIHMNVHKERFNTPNSISASATENTADKAVTANSKFALNSPLIVTNMGPSTSSQILCRNGNISSPRTSC
jgi:hypothetical protein